MLSQQRRPFGITLVELLVTMAVGGVVLSLVAAICVREQRLFADLGAQNATAVQLRDAEAILPIDLRAASAPQGDVREARDTSIELRGLVASAVICDTAQGGAVLAPASASATTYAGYLTMPDAGDTAWVLAPGDSSEVWEPYRVAASGSYAAGACGSLGPRLTSESASSPRALLSLEGFAAAARLGMPLRVTRPLRYSLYRGTDGRWYLGQRDWSSVTQRFNGIQPVSGPLLPPAKGGLEFRYLDSAANVLATPVADTRAIAAILVDVRGETRSDVRALGAATSAGPRADSATLWILLRNRR